MIISKITAFFVKNINFIIIIFIIVSFFVVFNYFTSKNDFYLEKNPIFVTGTIVGTLPGKGSHYYKYTFKVSNNEYMGYICCVSIYPINAVGKPIIVVYEKNNPKNNKGLLTQADFYRWGLDIPDSLLFLYLYNKKIF